jgi:hypothetical protein
MDNRLFQGHHINGVVYTYELIVNIRTWIPRTDEGGSLSKCQKVRCTLIIGLLCILELAITAATGSVAHSPSNYHTQNSTRFWNRFWIRSSNP